MTKELAEFLRELTDLSIKHGMVISTPGDGEGPCVRPLDYPEIKLFCGYHTFHDGSELIWTYPGEANFEKCTRDIDPYR